VKLNKSVLALGLAFVMVFSVAGLIHIQREADAEFQSTVHGVNAQNLSVRALYSILKHPLQYGELLVYSLPSNTQTVFEKAPLQDNNTRTEIYNFINSNPGIQFRAICGGLGLSIGVVQFHLAQLQKSGLITSFRKGRYKRFFTARKFTRKEMDTIAALRLDTVRNILKALLNGKRVSHHELAMQVSISSQGLTWQMNRLRETELVQECRNGLNVTYSLSQTYAGLVMETIALLES
jgi:predicted transcriptional regulator